MSELNASENISELENIKNNINEKVLKNTDTNDLQNMQDSQTQELTKDSLIQYIQDIHKKIEFLDIDIEFHIFYVTNEIKNILKTLGNKDKDIIAIQKNLDSIDKDIQKRSFSNFFIQYALLYEAFQKLKELLNNGHTNTIPTPQTPLSLYIKRGGGGVNPPEHANGNQLPPAHASDTDLQELESLLSIIQKGIKNSQELYKKENEVRKQLLEKLHVLEKQVLEG